MKRRLAEPAAIEAEIDHIRSLGLDGLRQRWRAMFGAPPSAGLTKDVIARLIAYRIQEAAFGGLDRETIRLLDRLARGERPNELNRRLKAGTVLVREYQGERHTVTVVPGGFVWREKTYTSLSIIARAITGTVWSGPRFFGSRGGVQFDLTIESVGAAATGAPAARPRGPAPINSKSADQGTS